MGSIVKEPHERRLHGGGDAVDDNLRGGTKRGSVTRRYVRGKNMREC